MRKKGFTLAEVLITLGIIGIVAAMTLPALMSKYKEQELATRTKKTYSVINQAIQKYQADSETIGDVTGLFDTTKTSAQTVDDFSKYFTPVRICKTGCKDLSYEIKYSSALEGDTGKNESSNMGYYPKFVLPDGAVISILQENGCNRTYTSNAYNSDGSLKRNPDGTIVTYNDTQTSCASIFFDVNGPALPNQFGRDVFEMRIRADGSTYGWYMTGWSSLQNILAGKKALYKNYTSGDSFK